MKNFTKIIHRRVAQFLNEATATVVHSYERYLKNDLPKTEGEPPKEPEEFKKFHDAGKSAASHLETLLKLANATDTSKEEQKTAEEDERKQELRTQLKSAKEEIDGRD